MQQQIPKVCDWISARAGCSIENMFDLLRERVDSDVKTMREVAKHDKIELRILDPRKFAVTVQWDSGGIISSAGVAFERDHVVITARNMRTDQHLFTATPAVNVAGECQLVLEGTDTPLELWQVSRKALEPLFFRK